MHPDNFDPFSRSTTRNPYPYYAALREHAPVYQPPGCDYFCVSRHADILRVVSDPETFSSRIVSILVRSGDSLLVLDKPSLDIGPVDVLAIEDPPRHRQQRRIVGGVLTRSFVAGLEPQIRDLARSLLTPMIAEGGGDFMEQVAFKLPVRVMVMLLGLPTEDADQLKDWSDHAVALLSGVNTQDEMQTHMFANLAFYQYLEQWCQQPPQTPLMDALVEAREQGALSEREVASIVMQLIIAGSDSSSSLMGSAAAALCADDDLRQQVQADPAHIVPLLEETLRLETPFQGHFRVTTRETELGGVRLAEGTRLMVLWASGNRDSEALDVPDSLRLDRKRSRHLGFGHGLHHCIGAALARLEGRVVLEELLAQQPQRADEQPAPVWRHSVFVRTLASLPMVLQAKHRQPAVSPRTGTMAAQQPAM